ncbi:MAG: PQQ-like beta-propeller repeat protein [Bifidobacteriaceae bacterium]|nr:PQQ-like beta-propeller repeat protein [Bifidobacteriaceae bacterium]
MLDGRFDVTGFATSNWRTTFGWVNSGQLKQPPMLDGQTILAYGYNRGANSPTVVAAVDLGSGSPKWQIDLASEEGEQSGGTRQIFSEPTGDGGVLVTVSTHHGYLAVQLGSDGEVLTVLEHTVCLAVVDGLAAFRTLDGDSSEVWAAEVSALDEPRWRQDEPGGWVRSPHVLTSTTGQFFVLGRNSYLDAQTGQPVGFGGDAWEDSDDYTSMATYMLTDEGTALRLTSGEAGGRVFAVDPDTGEELWEHSAPLFDPFAYYESFWHGGGYIAVRSGPDTYGDEFVVLEEKTGDEIVTVEGSVLLGVVNSALLLSPSADSFANNNDEFTGYQLKDGSKVLSLDACQGHSDIDDILFGTSVVYTLCRTGWSPLEQLTVAAHSADTAGEELWSLELPDDIAQSSLRGTRLMQLDDTLCLLLDVAYECRADRCQAGDESGLLIPLESG